MTKTALITALAVTAAATGLAVAGLLGYEVYKNSQQTPEPTPIAGGIGEPTPAPDITPEITIFPSLEITPTPSSEVTPTPTPEATPVPNIENIPLVEDGFMGMTPYTKPPYYFLIAGGTITAVEPVNPKDNTVLFAVTIAGNKVSKQCNVLPNYGVWGGGKRIDLKLCTYAGITLWIKADQKTFIARNSEYIGRGLDLLSPALRVGDVIPEVDIGINFNGIASDNDITTNRQSLTNINNYVGTKSPPRSNTDFLFYAGAIVIE